MKTKKLLLLLTVLLLTVCLGLTACDNDKKNSDSTTQTESAEGTQPSPGTEANSGESTTTQPDESTTAPDSTTTVPGENTNPTPHEHTWDAGVVTTAATCSAKGVKTFTCTACKETKTEEIPVDPNNHVHTEIRNRKDATCGDLGNTGDTFCTDCQKVVKAGDAIPKLTAHTWDNGVITQTPTCSKDGVKTITCTVCGETKTETVGATGEHQDVYTPTLDLLHHTHTCETCTEINEVLDHRHADGDNGQLITEHDCLENDFILFTCADCGVSYKVEVPNTAKTAHNFGEWSALVPATCRSEGIMMHTCADCGKTETVLIPIDSSAHSWDEGKVTKNASCTEEGVLTFTCHHCNETKTRSIPKIAHTYVESADNEGWVTKTCSSCNHVTRYYDASKKIAAEVPVADLQDDKAMDVALEKATIQLPGEVLSQIKESGESTVEIKADILDNSAKDSLLQSNNDLTSEQKELLQNVEIYNFGVKVGEKSLTETENFAQKVTVTLPYELKEGEDPEGIVIWYVQENGEIVSIDAIYADGTVTFEVDHFSFYAIAYVETPAMRCAKGIHEWEVAEVVPATCESTGYTILQCAHCGTHSFDHFTDRLPHVYGETLTEEATCDRAGYTYHICENCGEREILSTVKPLGHTPDQVATCTEDSHCTRCGELLVPALGHEWSGWTTVVEPTYTREGIRRRYCTRCGEMEETLIAKRVDIDQLEYKSYEELLNALLNSFLRSEGASLHFTMQSEMIPGGTVKATVAKENNGYVIWMESTAAENGQTVAVFIQNGKITSINGNGDAIVMNLDQIFGGMDFETLMERAAYGISIADRMIDLYAGQILSVLGKSANALDPLFDLLKVPIKTADLEQLIKDAKALYVYEVRKLGFQTELYMDANANVPTVNTLLNALAFIGTVTDAENGKIYEISAAELLRKLSVVTDWIETESTKPILEIVYNYIQDAVAKKYPEVTDYRSFQNKVKSLISGDMTAKELVDLLISYSEGENALTLNDLYSLADQTLVELGKAGVVPFEEGMHVEEFAKSFYDETLDELLEMTGTEMTVDDLFGMIFDLTLEQIPDPSGKTESMQELLQTACNLFKQIDSDLVLTVKTNANGEITDVAFKGGVSGPEIKNNSAAGYEFERGLTVYQLDETNALYVINEGGDPELYLAELKSDAEASKVTKLTGFYPENDDWMKPLQIMRPDDQIYSMMVDSIRQSVTGTGVYGTAPAPTTEEPTTVNYLSVDFSLTVSPDIRVQKPPVASELPTTEPKVTENADGSITVSDLPAGYEWDMSYGSEGLYVPLRSLLQKDDALSRKYGMEIYRLPEAYRRDNSGESYFGMEGVFINGRFYYLNEETHGGKTVVVRKAFAEPIDAFLKDPASLMLENMVEFGILDSDGNVPVYRTILGYLYRNSEDKWVLIPENAAEIRTEWRSVESYDKDNGYDYEKEKPVNLVYANLEIPLDELGTLVVTSYGTDGMQSFGDDENRSYYTNLTLQSADGEHSYSAQARLLEDGTMEIMAIYDVEEELPVVRILHLQETDILESQEIEKEVEYQLDNGYETVLLNDQPYELPSGLTVYWVRVQEESRKSEEVYVLVGNTFFEASIYEDADEISMDASRPANVYGLSEITLPDGSKMFVLGNDERYVSRDQFDDNGNYAGTAYTPVALTYGYVALGNGEYVWACTDGETVVYYGVSGSESVWVSYEAYLGVDSLLTRQNDGSYLINARFVDLLREQSEKSGYGMVINLNGTKRIVGTTEADSYSIYYSVPVVRFAHSSNHGVNPDYQEELVDWETWYRWFDRRDEGDVTRVVKEDGSVVLVSTDPYNNELRVYSESGIPLRWESAGTFEQVMSEKYGRTVYSYLTRYTDNQERYLLQDGKFFNYSTTGYLVPIETASAPDLSYTIQVSDLQLYAMKVMTDGESDASEYYDLPVYRGDVQSNWYNWNSSEQYFQIRGSELYVLTGVETDGDLIVRFEGAVSWSEFLKQFRLEEGTEQSGDTLQDGTAVYEKSYSLYDAEDHFYGRKTIRYYRDRSGATVYMIEYNYRDSLVIGSAATDVPAYDGYETEIHSYENGEFTFAVLYRYEYETIYVVEIDGHYYRAYVDSYADEEGNTTEALRISGTCGEEDFLRSASSMETGNAVLIDGVWYLVEEIYEDEMIVYSPDPESERMEMSVEEWNSLNLPKEQIGTDGNSNLVYRVSGTRTNEDGSPADDGQEYFFAFVGEDSVFTVNKIADEIASCIGVKYGDALDDPEIFEQIGTTGEGFEVCEVAYRRVDVEEAELPDGRAYWKYCNDSDSGWIELIPGSYTRVNFYTEYNEETGEKETVVRFDDLEEISLTVSLRELVNFDALVTTMDNGCVRISERLLVALENYADDLTESNVTVLNVGFEYYPAMSLTYSDLVALFRD